MALKDLSAFLAPNLELPWRDRVFVVAPPSKEDGVRLAAINALGVATYLNAMEPCPTCGRATDKHEISEDYQRIAESIKDRDLGEISLGTAYQEMIDAGMPGADVDMYALYALYYWTLGEETADKVIEARHEKVSGESDPKASAPKPSQSGRSTGSARSSQSAKTAPRSTRTTKSRKS